jgi:hypothetical protein
MSQKRLLGFLVIAIFTILVYYPSLWHVARSDQIVYFFVTANKHDWASLALSCFDINRWGIYAPGDQKLFRPLLFFFLGTEKYLFHYNFWAWQATGVFLHLMVVWFLMKLLWQMVPGRVAFACTLFFAVLFMNMEMVIWTHINSYLIFVIALLMVLDRVYACMNTDNDDQGKNMLIIALCFLIAGFIYETSNIFAIVVAAFLMKKRYSWIILVSPVLFFILDVMSLKAHHIVSDMKAPDLGQGVNHVMVAWGFWIYSALWPWLLHMYFDTRNMLTEASFNPVFSYGAVIMALILTAFGCRRLGPSKRNFIFLIVIMLFFYALVIVIGRGQGNSISVLLTRNIHYYYPFWALLMIVAGILIGAVQNQKFQTALVVILVGLSIMNGMRLYQVNDIQARGSLPSILLVRSVERLIEEKKSGKDFSFYVSPNYPGNYAYADIYGRKSSFIGMLFPQYYKENMPKYNFNPL